MPLRFSELDVPVPVGMLDVELEVVMGPMGDDVVRLRVDVTYEVTVITLLVVDNSELEFEAVTGDVWYELVVLLIVTVLLDEI